MESIKEIQVNQKPRGGARPGAGRLPKTLDDRWLRARGITPLQASEILAWADEREQWRKVFSCEDVAIVLRGLMYLTDRRDGKPAQQINVTSQSITINASDLERARAIVAEIRGESIPIIGTAETPAALGDLSSTDVRAIESAITSDDTEEIKAKLCFGATMGQ